MKSFQTFNNPELKAKYEKLKYFKTSLFNKSIFSIGNKEIIEKYENHIEFELCKYNIIEYVKNKLPIPNKILSLSYYYGDHQDKSDVKIYDTLQSTIRRYNNMEVESDMDPLIEQLTNLKLRL